MEAEERTSTWTELLFERLPQAIYHSFAAMLNGEEYEWLTWPGRVLRISLLIAVITIGSAYTANLAACFTSSNVVVHGPKDMKDLKAAHVCVESPAWFPYARPFARSLVSAVGATAEARMDWCYKELINDRVDAVIHTREVLRVTSFHHCATVILAPSIKFIPMFVPIFTSKNARGQAFTKNLTCTLAQLQITPLFQMLQQHYLREDHECPPHQSEEVQPITFSSMSGVFIICSVVAVCAMLSALYIGAGGGPAPPPPPDEVGTPARAKSYEYEHDLAVEEGTRQFQEASAKVYCSSLPPKTLLEARREVLQMKPKETFLARDTQAATRVEVKAKSATRPTRELQSRTV